ncbi:MAG: Tfp pilus assembly protein FimT/FimU, partial [Verrucomicrobiales bacterium]
MRLSPIQRPPAPSSAPAPRGFSLIEILVVLAVLAIIMAFSIPAFSGLTGSVSLSSATRNVSNALALARAEAISVNTITRVAIPVSWPANPGANFRSLSIWAWNRES